MEHWDKKMFNKLLDLGIERAKASTIIGLVAEERQAADRDGYKRGYENGYDIGFAKGSGRPS